MEARNLTAVRQWLENSSAVQLVFEDNVLLAASPRLKEYLPGVLEGDPAEKVFGDRYEAFSAYDGEGCLLFPMRGAGGLLNVKVTVWMDCILAELTKDMSELSASAMLTIADSITEPMATLMALSPKLLPQLPETEGNIQKAAMFNRSLYSLMREAKNIQAAVSVPHVRDSLPHVNIVAWLEEFAQKLSPLCGMAERKFVLDVPSKGFVCAIDRELLERAILNLVSNAIKFTEKGGTVTLHANRLASGKVRITLEDDGCGIAPDQMASVFDRKENRKLIPDSREGSGLGLPVARNIVMGHGGTLMLESQQGKGTRVHITLQSVNASGQLLLRSEVKTPLVSGGYDLMLVELCHVLPWEVYDFRGTDL